MLCERCKIREANIQYTEIVNGVKTEHNYCAQCAKEMDFGPYSAIFEGDFPLSKLLSGLLGIGEDHEEEKVSQVVCPTCKTTYEEFVKNSRFGCQDCYSVFDLLICDNIKQMQGNDAHKGKHPRFQQSPVSGKRAFESLLSGEAEEGELKQSDKSPKEQIDLLEARLKEAIRREEYETAAICRDKIKELREGMAQ